jgi:hypothetical protein
MMTVMILVLFVHWSLVPSRARPLRSLMLVVVFIPLLRFTEIPLFNILLMLIRL